MTCDDNERENTGIYCSLEGDDYVVRIAALRELLEQAESFRTEGGIAFRFADAAVAGELLSAIEKERECCPFLRITLEFPEHEAGLLLRVEGSAEARPVIEEVFGDGLKRSLQKSSTSR